MKHHVKRITQFVISLAILAGTGYLTLKNVNFAEFIQAFSKPNYWWILACVPIQIFSHFLRAVRWKTLLAPVKKDVSLQNAFSSVMIGYLINQFLPRGGEIARPFYFSRRENVPMSTALATVLLERFLDVLSLVVFGGFSFVLFHDRIASVFPNFGNDAFYKILLPFIGLIAFIVALMKTNLGEFLLRICVKPFSEKIYERLSLHLTSFIHGFSILESPAQYTRVIIETIPIWFLYTMPMYLCLFAFGFDKTYGLGFLDANILLVIVTLAFTIAPTPGAFGVYQAFLQLALVNFYHIPSEIALAYATITWGMGFFTVVVVGSIYYFRESAHGLTLKQLEEAEEEISE